MYGTAADSSTMRDFLLQTNHNAEMVQDERVLIDCVERGVLEPYEAALLMCPCRPSKCPGGYQKLIQRTETAIQEYLDFCEMTGRLHNMEAYIECTEKLREIWGLWKEVEDDDGTIIYD